MSAHAGIKNGNPQVGGADRLTDLLTRRCGTGETVRDVGDSYRPDSLVSETGQNTGDGGDVRRSAHNPATTERPADSRSDSNMNKGDPVRGTRARWRWYARIPSPTWGLGEADASVASCPYDFGGTTREVV